MGVLKKCVFIVDDDEDDRELIQNAVQSQFTEFEIKLMDGVAFYAHLESDKLPVPDYVFLDLNMPLRNGFECLEEARSKPNYDQVIIYVLSTSKNPDDEVKAMRLGAQSYYTKPFNYSDLKEIIAKFLLPGLKTSN